MNVALSKEHGLFTIWAIPVTHNELSVYPKFKIQFSTEALPNTRYYRYQGFEENYRY
jgi:hypothetical protein